MLKTFSKVAELENKDNKKDHQQLVAYQLQKRKKLPTFQLSEELKGKLV
jgi:hypothetical protein